MAESTRPGPREAGLRLGTLPPGPRNDISDVEGVRVGHTSVVEGRDVRTGVTVILPHGGDLFREKVIAAAHTINGFGKPFGLEQVRELGTLESPIALTGTLNVPRVADALISWMLARDADIARATTTVNVVVGECSDAYLNDARGRHVGEAHVLAALAGASAGAMAQGSVGTGGTGAPAGAIAQGSVGAGVAGAPAGAIAQGSVGAGGAGAPAGAIAQGSVGAGTGMVAFGFKGGVGSASRLVGDYTLGALLVANYGRRGQLTIAGVPVGRLLAGPPAQPERGSVMIVLATDAPLTSRQLGRLCRRAVHGLARTGSISGHGSGDFVLAFSTAQRIPHGAGAAELTLRCLGDDGPGLDGLFQAVVEAVEEAAVSALFRAETVVGRDGHVAEALPVPRVLELLRERGCLG